MSLLCASLLVLVRDGNGQASAERAEASGCEYAMEKVAKRSGFIQRGIRKQQSMAVFSDVWLAWSFQTNFMYKSVM